VEPTSRWRLLVPCPTPRELRSGGDAPDRGMGAGSLPRHPARRLRGWASTNELALDRPQADRLHGHARSERDADADPHADGDPGCGARDLPVPRRVPECGAARTRQVEALLARTSPPSARRIEL